MEGKHSWLGTHEWKTLCRSYYRLFPLILPATLEGWFYLHLSGDPRIGGTPPPPRAHLDSSDSTQPSTQDSQPRLESNKPTMMHTVLQQKGPRWVFRWFFKVISLWEIQGHAWKSKRNLLCVCERERALRHCGLPSNCMLYFCRSAASITVAVGRMCVSRVPCNLWRKVCAFGEGKPASAFAEFCELEPNNRHLWKAPVPGKQREDLISITSSPSGCLLWKYLEKGSEALGDWDFEVQEEGNSRLQLNSDSHEA